MLDKICNSKLNGKKFSIFMIMMHKKRFTNANANSRRCKPAREWKNNNFKLVLCIMDDNCKIINLKMQNEGR